MNKIKVGFFSFSYLSDPAAYVEWHQLDHMPEQFRIAGLSWGQRFFATRSCRDATVVRSSAFATASHLQCYLLEDPKRVLVEFEALGRELTALGRMRNDIVPCSQGSYQLIATHAAARVLVSPEAVPYRPNRGVFVIVEDVIDASRLDQWVRDQHSSCVPAILGTAGVVGVWTFASTGAYGVIRTDRRVTMIYLDDDPASVAARLAPLLDLRWRDAPVETVFAGPLASVIPPPRGWAAEGQ